MVQFPFTNYKTVSIDTGSNDFVLYVATARCMLVFAPNEDHDGLIRYDSGGSNLHYISREDSGASGQVMMGAVIIPSGGVVRGSGAGGLRVDGTLHIFELP
jgi:hypothetical protein